jgi:hypothetical protein
MYKTFAKHLLVIAFIIYLGAAIIEGLLALAGTFGFLLGFVVSVVALFLLQATLVKAVQDVRDGRADMSISETVSAAVPYLGPVAGASILAGIAISIGLFLLIIPGLFLITIWAVIVPVIVIERSGVLASFGRSRELVRGHGWHVFWTLVLVFLIMLAVNIVLGVIFLALPRVLSSSLSSIISGTLISPYLALVVTLVYYRLVGISVTTGAGQYAGYQQPSQSDPGYGGYGQSPQDGGQYGGYQQPPPGGGYDQPPPGGGYGGYQQPPPGGGYDQPPPGSGDGGYQQPPPGGGHQQPPPGGGYQQPPPGGSEPPTQQVPRSDDWDPPPQPPR